MLEMHAITSEMKAPRTIGAGGLGTAGAAPRSNRSGPVISRKRSCPGSLVFKD